MKKYLYLIILLIVGILLFYLNYIKPPFIESKIGGKADLAYNIEQLESTENIKVLVTENDYMENEVVYEIYNDEGDFSIKNIDNLTSLARFTVIYDENEDINSISYEFSLNNKSSLAILETLIKSTLIDLTDAGYNKIKDYLKIPESNLNIKYDRRRYMTSDKTLSLVYNSDINVFTFLIK